jgi:hypothetical protein
VYTGIDYVHGNIKGQVSAELFTTERPGDNAVNESFFSRFKEEWRACSTEARTFEELEKMVRKAIDYYNTQRYHSRIGLTAPLKFTKEQADIMQCNIQKWFPEGVQHRSRHYAGQIDEYIWRPMCAYCKDVANTRTSMQIDKKINRCRPVK